MEHGETYYSIGALQSRNGVEEWTWTDDRYDKIRDSIGIVFKTRQEAERVLKFWKENYGAV